MKYICIRSIFLIIASISLAIALACGLPDYLSSSYSLIKTTTLIESGNFEEAHQYGQSILESWQKKPDAIVHKNLDPLLTIAIKIESQDLYASIKNKALQSLPQGQSLEEDIILKHEPYFQSISLAKKPILSSKIPDSLIKFLVTRISVDPTYITKYRLTPEKLKSQIHTNLHNLLQGPNSTIISEILHVIALESLKFPKDKIYLFLKDPEINQDWHGQFVGSLNYLVIANNINNTDQFNEILMHEITHKLMQILFQNDSNPYSSLLNSLLFLTNHNPSQKIAYQKATKELTTSSSNLIDAINANQITPTHHLLHTLDSIQSIHDFYTEDEFDAEYIVKLIEPMGSNRYQDPHVQKLLSPLATYWQLHIRPKIHAYLRNNAHYNDLLK